MGLVIVASVLLGCGLADPQLVLVNRSAAAITVGPGVIVPPCTTVALKPDDYEMARAQGIAMAERGERWSAPEGALVWNDWGVSGSGPVTFSLIVSGSAGPESQRGTVPEDQLPPCGGDPVGIRPGTPLMGG